MAKNNNQASGSDTTKDNSFFRDGMATWIVVGSLIILIVLLYKSFQNIKCDDDNAFTNAKDLLNIVLPLLGTWIGTILAFYFGSKNFEAANKNIQNMVATVTGPDKGLKELKVSDVMFKPDTIALKIVDNYDSFTGLPLSDLIKLMDDTVSERLPVLEAKTMKFIFLIYRSTIERFTTGYTNGTIKLKDGTTADINKVKTLTVKDMLGSDSKLIKDINDATKSSCFLPVTATMAEVRKMMQDNTICQDVFITQTGSRDESVIGWITNNLVIEKSELFKKTTA